MQYTVQYTIQRQTGRQIDSNRTITTQHRTGPDGRRKVECGGERHGGEDSPIWYAHMLIVVKIFRLFENFEIDVFPLPGCLLRVYGV